MDTEKESAPPAHSALVGANFTGLEPASHRYFLNGRRVVGINEALTLSGLKPDLGGLRGRHARNVEYAGDRGVAVHAMCALDDTGQAELYEMDPNLLGYLEAWRSFKAEYRYVPDFTETPLVHHTYVFGGTPDSAGYSGKLGVYCVVERKSRALEPWDELQVAGQAILLADVYRKAPQAKLLVQLRDDERYTVEECRRREARGIFLAAVTVASEILRRG